MPNPICRLTAAVALTVLASPLAAQEFIVFESPTGNIGCFIATGPDAVARCDIRTYTPSFPRRPRDCDLDYGMAFEVFPRANRGVVACVGDTALGGGGATLGYGRQISAGGLTCYSEKTGMTCLNAAGHGFRVSKARQEVF